MVRLIVLVFSLLIMNSVFATHGDNLISAGIKSRGMAGIGYALPLGAESSLKNPSLLSFVDADEFTFGATYFMPSVEATNKLTNKTAKSKSDGLPVPSIGFVKKVTDTIHFGLGAYGTSGLGVDYRDSAASDGLYRMSTNLSVLKFVPTMSYQYDDFSVGLGFAMQYGTLGIAYDRNVTLAAGLGGGAVGHEGSGTSYDISYGFDIGLSYNLMKTMFIALNYQSKISADYKQQIAPASADFQISPTMSDKMEQPAELGVGFAYKTAMFALSFDYKKVFWESAKAFKDFYWEDQNIFTIGGSYTWQKTTFRLGYSHADSPLQDKALKTTTPPNAYAIHALNALGFPATIESHIGFGIGHQFSGTFGMDVAYVYAPEVSSTALAYNQSLATTFNFDVKHSQQSISLGLNYKF